MKIQRAERAVIATDDDLRLPLKKQRERAACGADIDCLPQPVQNQNVLVERGVHERGLEISRTARAGQLRQ